MADKELPEVELDQYPSGISAGERAILTALQGWQHEARELSKAEHAENQARMVDMDRELKSVSAAVKLGYPNGDADAHRRYHETLIEKAKQRAAFYQELRTELAKKGIWAVIGLLAVALWAFIKSKVVS